MPAFARNFIHTTFFANFLISAKNCPTKRGCRSAISAKSTTLTHMNQVKDTARALVRIGFDGLVHKTFRGHLAQERFEHEVLVLKYLERKGCDFVPRLLSADPEILKIVTSNCGARIEQLSEDKMKALFAELETYGVRHEDPFMRNVTYRIADGRFCLIDFEFATLLDAPGSPSLKPSVAQ